MNDEVIKLIVPFIALLVSFASFYNSILTKNYNKKMKEAILEKDLLFNVKIARTNWTSFTIKMLEFKGLNDDLKREMIKLALKRMKDYLLALDYACDKHNVGLINKESFDRNFLDILLTIKSDSSLLNVINSDKKNSYNALREYLSI